MVGSVDGSPAEYSVRLLGEIFQKPVYWIKMWRIAGSGLTMSEEVRLSVLHDIQ